MKVLYFVFLLVVIMFFSSCSNSQEEATFSPEEITCQVKSVLFLDATWVATDLSLFLVEKDKRSHVVATQVVGLIVDLYEINSCNEGEVYIRVWNGNVQKILLVKRGDQGFFVKVEDATKATYAQWQTIKKNAGYE